MTPAFDRTEDDETDWTSIARRECEVGLYDYTLQKSPGLVRLKFSVTSVQIKRCYLQYAQPDYSLWMVALPETILLVYRRYKYAPIVGINLFI